MKRQLLLSLLSCFMCLSLVGCSKKEEPQTKPTTDANEIVGVQGEDVKDEEGKYFYKTLNVKDFDTSKFDGVIRLSNINSKKHKGSTYANFQSPITYATLKEAKYYIEDDDFRKKVEADSWCEDFFLDYDNPNGYQGKSYATKVLVPSLDQQLTYEQILEKDTFLFLFEDVLLDEVFNTADRNHHSSDFEAMVDLLGAPSMILGDAMSLDGDLSSGFFNYIYEYDNCALIFSGLEFTGKDNAGSFDEIYYASNKKALNTFIDIQKAYGYKVLAE